LIEEKGGAINHMFHHSIHQKRKEVKDPFPEFQQLIWGLRKSGAASDDVKFQNRGVN
jgi:hypothetical protein